MNPILFESTENNFDTNGIGILADAIFVKSHMNATAFLNLKCSIRLQESIIKK